MTLLDLLNSTGRRKGPRLLGSFLHRVATGLEFSTLIRIAGRRMVTASAGAPAILNTCGDLEEGLKDPRLLYEAMRFTVEEMELDALCLVADLSVEAEACGCQVRFRERDLPAVISHPLEATEQPGELEIPDPGLDGRMPVFLEAMRLMAKNYRLLKAAVVTGPFTQAAHLKGPEIYMDSLRNPEGIKPIVDYCQEVTLSFAEALIGAGADVIVIAEPSASLLSPPSYCELSQRYVEKTVQAMDKPCILHICGDTTHIVEKMWDSGAACISVDDVDLSWLAEVAPDHVVLAGNIDNTVLLKSSPDEIRAETTKLLESVRGRKEFFALPGCDLAPETPLENIRAFVQTVKAYS